MNELLQKIASPHGMSILSVLAACVVIARYILVRKGKKTWPITVALILLALTVYFAAMNRNMVKFVTKGPWCTFHYFMGSKYFDQMEYYRLYRFCVLADRETGTNRLISLEKVRHLETYKRMKINKAAAIAQKEKPKYFTPARWEEFKRDWVAVAKRAPIWGWENMLNDRGFNPPPFWNVVPGFVAQFIMIENNQAFKIGRSFDFLLKLIAYILIAVFVGVDAALLSFLFVELAQYNTGHQIGTYFQFVFLSSLLAAMAFYRKGKNKIAGALFAMSAMFRIFPVFFMIGPGLVWLRKLIKHRKLPMKETALLVSFGVFCIVFLLLGLTQGKGFHTTKEFFENITMHAKDQQFDQNKFGLKRTMAVDWKDPWADTRKFALRVKNYENNKWLRYILWVSLMGLGVAAILRKTDNDAWAIPLGFVFIFAMIVLSRYYYLALVAFYIADKEQMKKGLYTLAGSTLFLAYPFLFLMPLYGFDRRAAFSATNYWFLFCFLSYPAYLLIADFIQRKKKAKEALDKADEHKTIEPAAPPATP